MIDNEGFGVVCVRLNMSCNTHEHSRTSCTWNFRFSKFYFSPASNFLWFEILWFKIMYKSFCCFLIIFWLICFVKVSLCYKWAYVINVFITAVVDTVAINIPQSLPLSFVIIIVILVLLTSILCYPFDKCVTSSIKSHYLKNWQKLQSNYVSNAHGILRNHSRQIRLLESKHLSQ